MLDSLPADPASEYNKRIEAQVRGGNVMVSTCCCWVSAAVHTTQVAPGMTACSLAKHLSVSPRASLRYLDACSSAWRTFPSRFRQRAAGRWRQRVQLLPHRHHQSRRQRNCQRQQQGLGHCRIPRLALLQPPALARPRQRQNRLHWEQQGRKLWRAQRQSLLEHPA